MSITPEMEEILQYLHNKDNYALFAGFAAFLCTGVEFSPDIDVFVSSPEDVKEISEDFLKEGWNLLSLNDFLVTVEKNGTTFDIIFSKIAEETFFPCRIKILYKGKHLFTVSLEALFLTKMHLIASLQRSPEKTARDRKVIQILRKKMDGKKVNELIMNLNDSFWTEEW